VPVSQAAHSRAPQAALVLETLQGCAAWEPFKGPTGAILWRLPASEGGTYTVSTRSCTCPADRYSHEGGCKHRRALQLYLLVLADVRRRLPQPTPPPPKETLDAVV